VSSVGVSHDNKWVVSGSWDRSVRIWDLQTGEAQLVLHGHTSLGTSQRVCISAPGSSLIAQCVRACMPAHIVYSVALSPAGGMLATSGEGGEKLCACL
jgi:WD40 repeat protein